MKTLFTALALTAALLATPAHAGRNCDARKPTAQTIMLGMGLAERTQAALYQAVTGQAEYQQHRHPDPGAPVQILGAGLGGRHREATLQFGHDGPHHRALLFERVHVTEQQVEFQPADPHG